MQALRHIFGYSDPAPAQINNLPLATANTKILSCIIAQQPLSDIAAMSRVCHRFNTAANFQNVWKQKALEYGLPDERLGNFLTEKHPRQRIKPLSVRIKDAALPMAAFTILTVATTILKLNI